jgi:hypothetical protein
MVIVKKCFVHILCYYTNLQCLTILIVPTDKNSNHCLNCYSKTTTFKGLAVLSLYIIAYFDVV